MKKIIICMLLLLPLIIVASVMLAIDIISVEAYIPVDSVVLNHSYVELDLSEQSYDDLVASVYPTSANNKDVEWTIVDVVKTVPDFEGEAATIDQNGKVEFFTYSTFKVVATASGKSASCTFYIKGDKVEDVEINAQTTELATGEKLRLEAVFHPIDAIVENLLWTSEDESILKVDNNGVITGIAEGSATVRVSVKDTDISDTLEITVTKGVTPYGNEFYATNGFDISGFDNIDSVTGGYVQDDKLYFNPSSENIVLTIDNQDVTVKKCQTSDITIENMDILNNSQLRVGKLPLTLKAVYLEAGREDFPVVEWSSSNSQIADINSQGLVTAYESGRVEFTARDSVTNKSVSIEIEVVRPISLIVLDMPQKQRGIAQNRVFGNLNYTSNGYEQAYIDVEFALPQNAEKSDFEYEVLNSDAAYFSDNRLMFNEIEQREEIVIKVSAKIRPYESVEVYTTYTLEVANGVNVYDYQSLKSVTDQGKAAFLQDDIVFGETANRVTLTNDLYGNGYTINLREYAENNDMEIDENLIRVDASDVTISNVTITFDDPEKISDPNGMHGYVLQIGEEGQQQRYTGIRIEYSVLENGYYAIDIHHSDVEIEGCIIRNTSNFAIFIPATKLEEELEDYSNVVMTNNIMSNIVAPALGMPTQSAEMQNGSSLHVKGFLDIYNWQDILSARMLDRDFLEGNDQMNAFFKNIVKNSLKNALKQPMFDELKYSMEVEGVNVDFIHLGIIAAGALYESNAEIVIEDENYILFDLELDNLIKELTGLSVGSFLQDIPLYCYSNEASITPESRFVESINLYERLRGEE